VTYSEQTDDVTALGDTGEVNKQTMLNKQEMCVQLSLHNKTLTNAERHYNDNQKVNAPFSSAVFNTRKREAESANDSLRRDQRLEPNTSD
jgi:hypothetical protein